MQKSSNKYSVLRIIDANINRAMEGMRVCEEVTRFILNNQNLTAKIKACRHRLQAELKKFPKTKSDLLKERESLKDVGRKLKVKENQRQDYQDIFFANLSRVKESLRVLEEFLKLIDYSISAKLKNLRYEVYDLEKKFAKKL